MNFLSSLGNGSKLPTVRKEASIEAPPALNQPVPQNRRTFIEEYNRLVKEFSTDPGNPGSVSCTNCTRCNMCMFCNGCRSCYRCTHCKDCEECNNCTHSARCKGCNACTHCDQSEFCSGSAYLILCQNLADCTYCLGCVGLSKKDFHILNKPYSRTQYFQLVKQLARELGL